MFVACFQTFECSSDGAAVGDLLGFVLKVENFNESRTPVLQPLNCFHLSVVIK